MRIKDLADLLGISEVEVIQMLEANDVIELNLKERKVSEEKDTGKLEVL